MSLVYRVQRAWRRYDPNYYLTVGVSVLCLMYYVFSGSSSAVSGSNTLPYHQTLDRYSAAILEQYAQNPSLDAVPFQWSQALEIDEWFEHHKDKVSDLTCVGLKEKINKPEQVRYNCEDDPDNKVIPITLRENVLFYMTDFYRQLFGKIFLAKVWPNPSRLVYLFPDKTVELNVDPTPKKAELSTRNLLQVAKKVSSFERATQNYVPKELTYEQFHYTTLLEKFSEDGEVKRLHKYYPDLKRARKYFQEGYDLDHQGHQYVDWRLYNSSNVFEGEMFNPLKIRLFHRLIRAWLHFANTHDVDTWMSRHTLAAWHHNGLREPFENNVDFHTSLESVMKLVEGKYNNTVVFDYSDLDSNIKGEYLLDIGPYFKMRDRNNRENQVDIRLVDLNSGLFLNVYGVASFSYELLYKFKMKPIMQSYSETDIPRIEALIQKYANNKENLLYDRSLQIFEMQDHQKLIPVKFENEVAWVPSNYDKVLRSWYVDPYVDARGGVKFRPGINMWLSLQSCKLKPFQNVPDPEDSLQCLEEDAEQKFFYERTKKATSEHIAFLAEHNDLNPPPELLQLTVEDRVGLY